MSNLVLFPAPFLYFHSVNNHQYWKQYVLDAVARHEKTHGIYTTEHKEKNTKVTTSFFSKHRISEFDDTTFLDHIVWEPLDAALNQVNLAVHPVESRLSNIWYNQFNSSGWHSAHTHPGAEWCGIYVVDLHEPNLTSFMHACGNSAAFTATLTTEEYAKEGTVIIFPGFLSHWVSPTSCENRLTVSFNISSSYANKQI